MHRTSSYCGLLGIAYVLAMVLLATVTLRGGTSEDRAFSSVTTMVDRSCVVQRMYAIARESSVRTSVQYWKKSLPGYGKQYLVVAVGFSTDERLATAYTFIYHIASKKLWYYDPVDDVKRPWKEWLREQCGT
jgi:hypothetical protein